MLERGSVWRRWDLHVHTPETAMEDRFDTWDDYLAAIEANPDVRVLGVTDYLLLDNYATLKQFRDGGRIQNIDFILPNIEFRLAPPTDKDTPVNIHLLVSPDDPKHITEINNALARLHWGYNKHLYSCTPDQLAELGQAIDPSLRDQRAARNKGVEQFKIDFSKFRDWYQQETWLRAHSLVAVSGNKDGLSGFLTGGGWAAMREEITRLSDVIFSGRPGEIDFWLGRGQPKEKIETMMKLGGPKPCIHGSDAHEIKSLFKPDNDRFCWIKADTNFEGLKQIILEPGERVFIGPTPPVYHDEARVIDKVTLKSGGEWFASDPIPLNAGLVSIIGQKGSGKSALAELIAFAAGSWESGEGSFIRRAGAHLDDLVIELQWADGSEIVAPLSESPPDNGRVRFLSQRFVERLCADDRLGDDLVREIEAVIFDALDPTDTLNASDFEELRHIRTASMIDNGDQLRGEINQLIRADITLRAALNKIPEKLQNKGKLLTEAAGLTAQIPKPSTDEEAATIGALQKARMELGRLQNSVGELKQKRQRIVDIRGKVQGISREIERYKDELTPLLSIAAIVEADWEAFVPKFHNNYETVLTRRDSELLLEIEKLEGDEVNPKDGTCSSVQKQIAALSEKESVDKARHDRIKAIQTRLAAIEVEVRRVQDEIDEGPAIRNELNKVRERRVNAYKAFFENLSDEQRALESLYQPVHDKLANREHEQDLQFSIRWEIDLNGWLARGGMLLDQRRTLPYGTMQEIANEARRSLLPAWMSGDTDKIAEAHGQFVEAFSSLSPSSYLRTGSTLADLLSWLYDVDQVKLSYGLKYRGTDLEKLSPGTKGIVLLILYLGLDERDTRPLIVDQPDENLDNESIFSLLTEYFRSAKKRRQIILITHNPNLVVNGDSEQVIIASAKFGENGLPSISYSSSALENTLPDGNGIRERTCRILEGGTDAFVRRERRYALLA
ncbi:TrlF family AAA-like ATPase [Rhizobium sp. 768_B6_N1_8]|uniref:TrlF family AAA-like ATPase n=1 Tax=unclassified Rhizobium TaxID=2613769 RepID=UPI003F2575C3